MARKTYQTRQLTEMTEYLRSMGHRHFTVAEICNHFHEHGVKLSMATVYRHLDRLIEQGAVARYAVDGAQGYCYEFIGDDHHTHDGHCFHCKCDCCGQLIHLSCHEIEQLVSHLDNSHGFYLNIGKTVFWGRCSSCAEKSVAGHSHGGCCA